MSNTRPAHVLSGEEALDEYFTALLDDEFELVDDTYTAVKLDLIESDNQKAEQVPSTQLQPEYALPIVKAPYNDVEVPDLDDVQKLLDKLESTDLADEPDIVTIIEKNNGEIAKVAPFVEEVQDWEIQTEEITETPVDEPEVVEQECVVEQPEVELETKPGVADITDWQNIARSENFQVLYFDVNGVTFAVPLDELGGIHRKGEMSHLIGRPGWYLGLQTNKDDQLDVVDTAKWVMPDRLQDDSHKEHYQYVVMLGESDWGLASTELKGTELLSTEKVRWRELSGKRPWLAGMVKEKMCALIHVEAMITMLNAGLDVKSLNR